MKHTKKYYVYSDELKTIVTAENAVKAALRALESHSGHINPYFIFVDERGFRDADSGAKFWIETEYILDILEAKGWSIEDERLD